MTRLLSLVNASASQRRRSYTVDEESDGVQSLFRGTAKKCSAVVKVHFLVEAPWWANQSGKFTRSQLGLIQ